MVNDRTVSQAFVDALGPGGPSSLKVRHAKTKYLVDPQLCGNSGVGSIPSSGTSYPFEKSDIYDDPMMPSQ